MHSYIYELKYLVNSSETMPVNIGETLIYELLCSVRAHTVYETDPRFQTKFYFIYQGLTCLLSYSVQGLEK